ncbi:tRNA (adenosine(37)-N6)-threonylcarbamoyltransferase complex transferase subunit TsaD [Helicobacter pametensis]|uniref:tRNA (adenosine(37)-N6)-threonylcarbamoyltransferase complex transferase subunit TsaD n=1 Tax=Helicobacter pametensis TaxID=95149 RepID=UPI00047FC05D|nr:tRNA (adenosine(37)-N6)-threonylcarbamoyltransferase complex transferase subunit TsaD [Helicobacter pametensis]
MILSIESSCDDSSLALTSIQECKLLFHQKISQEAEHSLHGGVVPELASRLHAQKLPLILKNLKTFLHGNFSKIKAIAITTEPGLSVTLIEGLMMAKALALSLKIPLISINHLKGHIYSLFINQQQCIFPLSVLLVSGGHTMILEASENEVRIIAQSKDDSFGESFDKASKMLGLGYPGGPIIQSLAQECQEDLYTLPIPLQHSKELAFSFSGLKNAFRLEIERQGSNLNPNALAKAFQQSACAHIVQKCKLYFQTKKENQQAIPHFAIVGGASANLYLREKIQDLCATYNSNLLLAPLEFCSDNAAMIGRVGVEEYKKQNFSDLFSLEVSPRNTQFKS